MFPPYLSLSPLSHHTILVEMWEGFLGFWVNFYNQFVKVEIEDIADFLENNIVEVTNES